MVTVLLCGWLTSQTWNRAAVKNQTKLTFYSYLKSYHNTNELFGILLALYVFCFVFFLKQIPYILSVNIIRTVFPDWNFVIKGARPFYIMQRALPLEILKVYGRLLKGHQGQYQGQQRPLPPWPSSNSRHDFTFFKGQTETLTLFQRLKPNPTLTLYYFTFSLKTHKVIRISVITVCAALVWWK